MSTKTAKPAETAKPESKPAVSFTLVDEVKQNRDTRENPYTELVAALCAEGVIDTRKGAEFTTTDKRTTVSSQLKRAGDAAKVDLRKTVTENKDGSLTFAVRAVTRKPAESDAKTAESDAPSA